MKSVLAFLRNNLQRFLTGALIGGGLFLVIIGGICYYLLHDQASWRLTSGLALTGMGAVLVAMVSGVRLAATRTIQDWVDKAAVGPMLAKVIFKQSLGVSDKRPGGSKEIAAKLEGATVGQAKAVLSETLSDLFHGDSLDRWLPAQGRWIAKRLTSTAGWVATRSIVSQLPGAEDDTADLDLLDLRNRLGESLSNRAVSLATTRATLLAWGVTAIACVACLLVAVALS